jgi:hypothetical protein
MMRGRIALAAAIAVACVAGGAIVAMQGRSPAAENIRAPRYDVRVEVLPDGSLDIVETVVLAVGAKPMRWFDRTVPRRRTDGLTNASGLMDGQAVPVSIDASRDLKFRWDFSPTANATHTFEMRYRASHVLAREIDGPRLVWTALPRKHTYPIDAAEITLFAPAGSIATHVGATGGEVLPPTVGRPGVVIAGQSLGRDRDVTVDITFAPNSITPREPEWFVVQDRQLNMLPAWLAGAVCILVVGVGILIMSFARLPRPNADLDAEFITPASEDAAPAGLAAWLISRSAANAWLAMQAAFFRLVRDGVLLIERRGAVSRWRPAFDVSPKSPVDLRDFAQHESWILDMLRAENGKADLRRFMMRLSRRQSKFRGALAADASARGWIDTERLRTQRWLQVTGLVLVFSGLLGAMALIPLIDRFGPVPITMPVAVVVTGLIYLIVSAAMSVKSEAGMNEAARWRARVAELKQIIKDGVSGQSPLDFERWFPLAIGAGMGGRWLKAFRAQLETAGTTLEWMRTIGSPDTVVASLETMVMVSGASHGGGAGAGGAAGGGSSSAG